ncbi:hypothetical protein D3C87_2092750 [compost metagenome]
MAVAQIVSAIVAKGFDKDTDGCDLRFEEGRVQLVDAHGQTLSLEALVEMVRRALG